MSEKQQTWLYRVLILLEKHQTWLYRVLIVIGALLLIGGLLLWAEQFLNSQYSGLTSQGVWAYEAFEEALVFSVPGMLLIVLGLVVRPKAPPIGNADGMDDYQPLKWED